MGLRVRTDRDLQLVSNSCTPRSLRQEQGGSIKQPNVTVLVASAGENLLCQRMKLTKLLWDANISAEFSRQDNPKLKFEIASALERARRFRSYNLVSIYRRRVANIMIVYDR